VDDGEGMGRDDALLCLERHATSKLEDARDLFAIRSLGFRGEAIPSIASVSELVLVTREAESETGVRIDSWAGSIKSVTEVGAPKGTEIAVRRLFFNVPARRKFLKTVATEFGHVTHLVSNMALARPDVHFTLDHNGRTVFDLPASSDLGGRLRHALGADAASQMLAVEWDDQGSYRPGKLRVHGFVSTPSYTRSSTRGLHVFVNRRFVRDRIINHAVFESYRSLVPKGRYPLVVLFVDLPAEAVDVNVHPAKHEVRFQDQPVVHDAVTEAIRNALKTGDRAGAAALFDIKPDAAPQDEAGPQPPLPDDAAGARDALARYYQRLVRGEAAGGGQRWRPGPGSGSAPDPRPPPPDMDRATGESAASDLSAIDFSSLRVIGQAGVSYIIAESDDSLLLIDQHAAHERVAFERIRSQFADRAVARQALLFPVTVELNLQEARRVEAATPELLRMGFEVEPFGGATVAIKAVPALLGEADPAAMLVDVVDKLEGIGGLDPIDERFDEIFAVMACHSVVRAGKAMTETEIRALFRSMDQIDFPGHCPHGRDVVVKIPFSRLEKWFGR